MLFLPHRLPEYKRQTNGGPNGGPETSSFLGKNELLLVVIFELNEYLIQLGLIYLLFE